MGARSCVAALLVGLVVGPGVAAVLAADSPKPAPDAGVPPWSDAVEGLRGRLRVELRGEEAALWCSAYIELENTKRWSLSITDRPRVVVTVLDKDGTGVAPASSAEAVQGDRAQWAIVPYQAYLGLRVPSHATPLPADGTVRLTIGTRDWVLKPGPYQLRAVVSCERKEDGPRDQWIGTLELPPVEVVVPEPRDAEAEWGEPVRGMQTRLTFAKTAFAVDEPLLATVQVRVVDPESKYAPDVAVYKTSLGSQGDLPRSGLGATYRGEGDTFVEAVDDDGHATYTCTLDLGKAYGYAPPINRTFYVTVGYHVGYTGSKAVHAESRPVAIVVHVPQQAVLDYYVGELLAKRPREVRRQEGAEGAAWQNYPCDELVRIGKPAITRLEWISTTAIDKERLSDLTLALRAFGDDGIAALRRLQSMAEGNLRDAVARELRYWDEWQRRKDAPRGD